MSGEGPAGERILTARLELVPLTVDDADEMVEVLGDRRLHEFTGGHPATLDELRDRYARLVGGGSADRSAAWHNWIVRRLADRRAVGTMQATVTGGGRAAEVAWVVGVPWQGDGIASEAAKAVVAWLEQRRVQTITAHVHPGNAASAVVATRAGLTPTDTYHHGERLWRRRAPRRGATRPARVRRAPRADRPPDRP
jgi:RimJ/RimL family protein N-acetyltransferase